MRRDEFYKLPMRVQDYLVYIEAIKGHSSLSVIEYASDLRTFLRFIAKNKGFLQKNFFAYFFRSLPHFWLFIQTYSQLFIFHFI